MAERVEQPPRVKVSDQPVPSAAQDRHRSAHSGRFVGEFAMPSPQNLDERSRGSFHSSRSAGAALRIAVEIALPPVFKVSSRENGRFVGRHVLHKSSPLLLYADDAPGRAVWAERVTHWIAARDRSEQYQTVEERWVVASKPSRRHRAPGVSDERQGVQALVLKDEA